MVRKFRRVTIMTVGLETMGQRIRHLREKLRLTQTEIANKIGISQSAYNRYEQNEIKRYSETTLDNLAKALETTTEFILGQEGQHGKFEHVPPEILEWIATEESMAYITEAFIKFQQDKYAKFVKK